MLHFIKSEEENMLQHTGKRLNINTRLQCLLLVKLWSEMEDGRKLIYEMTHVLSSQVFPQCRHSKQMICPGWTTWWQALIYSWLFFHLYKQVYSEEKKHHHSWDPILCHIVHKLSRLMLYLPCWFKLGEASTSMGKGSSHPSPSSGFSLLLHTLSLSLHLYKHLGACYESEWGTDQVKNNFRNS